MGNTDILYHYCSTEAFHSIVRSRSVRLSSLTLSNDSLEGRLVNQAIRRLAERDGLDEKAIARLTSTIESVEQNFDGLGFCLSENGDLLSQWRGYSEDGTGISIGFSRPYLEWLSEQNESENKISFYVRQALYDSSDHDQTVQPAYETAKRHLESGALRWPIVRGLLSSQTDEEFEQDQKNTVVQLAKLNSVLYGLFPKLFVLKSAAFSEECEWRLLSYYLTSVNDNCEFRPARDRIVPYINLALPRHKLQPIVDVVLGPRHKSPIHVLEAFLKRSGFENVQVRLSAASYRR